MENKEWSVYIHTNLINNKKYIGMTCDVKTRFGKNGSGYLHKTKDGKYVQPAFANAIIKYGWDNFSHEIVKNGLTKFEADELESSLILQHQTRNPQNGYNIKEGGSNGRLSDETKKKLRETMLGRYDGEKNPFYGKTHTQEAKEEMSKKQKQLAKTRDISGVNNPMYGRELTLEERYARGNGARGKPKSEEVKNKISKANKEYYKTHQHHCLGTHKTEEQKEHMRQKMIGRKMSQEWKTNIGESHAPYIYICVETGQEFTSSAEAGRITNINKSSIQNAANGKQNTAGGLHWIKKEKTNMKS